MERTQGKLVATVLGAVLVGSAATAMGTPTCPFTSPAGLTVQCDDAYNQGRLSWMNWGVGGDWVTTAKSLLAADFNRDGYTDLAFVYQDQNGRIVNWAWQGNSCRSIAPKKPTAPTTTMAQL